MEELIEIFSMHEQRERLEIRDNYIQVGTWLELIDFNQITEHASIKKRWLVEKIIKKKEGDIEKYKFICKPLDIDKDDKIKKELANKILNKYNKELKASFVKCLIQGIEIRSVNELKRMVYKLGGNIKNGKQTNS